MPEWECNQCGAVLPRIARYCRKCGTAASPSRPQTESGVKWAWIAGICVWVVAGVLMAVAAAEEWEGLAAGAGFLFCILFFVGIVGGIIQSVKVLTRCTAGIFGQDQGS